MCVPTFRQPVPASYLRIIYIRVLALQAPINSWLLLPAAGSIYLAQVLLNERVSPPQLLRKLHHPYIVDCFESFIASGKLCIVMSFCAGGAPCSDQPLLATMTTTCSPQTHTHPLQTARAAEARLGCRKGTSINGCKGKRAYFWTRASSLTFFVSCALP